MKNKIMLVVSIMTFICLSFLLFQYCIPPKEKIEATVAKIETPKNTFEEIKDEDGQLVEKNEYNPKNEKVSTERYINGQLYCKKTYDASGNVSKIDIFEIDRTKKYEEYKPLSLTGDWLKKNKDKLKEAEMTSPEKKAIKTFEAYFASLNLNKPVVSIYTTKTERLVGFGVSGKAEKKELSAIIKLTVKYFLEVEKIAKEENSKMMKYDYVLNEVQEPEKNKTLSTASTFKDYYDFASGKLSEADFFKQNPPFQDVISNKGGM